MKRIIYNEKYNTKIECFIFSRRNVFIYITLLVPPPDNVYFLFVVMQYK